MTTLAAYNLPLDPYAARFAQGGIPKELMISPEQVAATLADLVEQPAVPLRVPVGRLGELIVQDTGEHASRPVRRSRTSTT